MLEKISPVWPKNVEQAEFLWGEEHSFARMLTLEVRKPEGERTGDQPGGGGVSSLALVLGVRKPEGERTGDQPGGGALRRWELAAV